MHATAISLYSPFFVIHCLLCFIVHLLEVPEFLGGSDTITITTQVGNTVILPCNVTANPEAVVTWERDGTELPENRSIDIPRLGLVIDTAQLQDTGSYNCKASNILGNNVKTIILEVQCKLTLISFLITANCNGAKN